MNILLILSCMMTGSLTAGVWAGTTNPVTVLRSRSVLGTPGEIVYKSGGAFYTIFKNDGMNASSVTDIDEDNNNFTDYVLPPIGEPLTLIKSGDSFSSDRFIIGYTDYKIQLRKYQDSSWSVTGTTQKEENVALE